MSDPFDLSGRIALTTGGDRGGDGPGDHAVQCHGGLSAIDAGAFITGSVIKVDGGMSGVVGGG